MSVASTVPHAAYGNSPWETHTVFNQVPPLEDLNLFESNLPLVEAVEREGAGWVRARACELGRFVGGEPKQQWGRLANENKPVLHTHDRYGNRIDEVEFHPAWHQLMKMGVENELHSLPWRSEESFAHTARAALYMTAMQAEAGFACPITMTFAVVPALRAQPEIAAEWEPLVSANHYDPRLIDASQKGCAIAGMAMTEKQGGSDVRANTTVAHPLNGGGAGAEYELVGHKWFCSAPMSDVFLVLAQATDDGPRFVLPAAADPARRLAQRVPHPAAEGQARQPLQRLLGDRVARRLGPHGRRAGTGCPDDHRDGRPHAAGLRDRQRRRHARAVVSATHHTAHRSAFGKLLSDQPLMRNVLADLCVEAEASTVLAMRLARAYDEAHADAQAGEDSSDAQLFKRLATAVGKYWTCKRAPNHAFEALECLGGAGYVEESGMPRLYREAPLASIWEGSGNVMSLDVLRALGRSPRSLEVFLEEVELARGADAGLDPRVAELKGQFTDPATLETRARRVVESMALCLQGSLLVRYAPAAVADAFCASRLGHDGGLEYGTLPARSDFQAIIDRSRPAALA